ncbi:heavy-metal-associated domain-containing protein [Niveibacterium sp. SC-1]|uniref:heavy-metal-associated domain-containing protein n=1 Tax=Niveibacterium sp. SC-1 TaxID=3135646 RepID=UPI00311D582A
MLTFEVKDMTCGHCVSTITKALKAADKDARIEIDLATHRVRVQPAETQADELADAIREAGYTPVAVSQPAVEPAKPATAGGCCGGCR